MWGSKVTHQQLSSRWCVFHSVAQNEQNEILLGGMGGGMVTSVNVTGTKVFIKNMFSHAEVNKVDFVTFLISIHLVVDRC